MLGIAFILVSVPLFYQVRADAVDSKQEAKNTFLSRLFRDVAKDIMKDPPKDLQVEDAWQKWQEENPDCGPECDPEADPDGDGRTNREEVEEGRNPLCNEEKEGKEHCEGESKNPPPKNQTQALSVLLFEETSAGTTFTREFDVARVTPDYDRWTVTWRLSGYQGVSTSYSIGLRDQEGTRFCCPPRNMQVLSDSDSWSATLDGEDRPPSGAKYRINVETNGAVSGTWHIQVTGIRDARTD